MAIVASGTPASAAAVNATARTPTSAPTGPANARTRRAAGGLPSVRAAVRRAEAAAA